MGAVYLIYSAYYVAVNIEGIQFMMTLLLISLYLMLMVIVMKNAVETRRLLKIQQKQIYENNVEPLMPSINLKVKLINHFIIVATFYFAFEIIVNGLIPTVQSASS